MIAALGQRFYTNHRLLRQNCFPLKITVEKLNLERLISPAHHPIEPDSHVN